jgi:large subunit ribosomal protein L6
VSRIGKQPIQVPTDVTVEINGNTITVKGPKGELNRTLHPLIGVKLDQGVVSVTRNGDEALDRALHGLSRTLVANMIEGVAKGYQKVLEIQGVGYKAEAQSNGLKLTVGLSHAVVYPAPPGIKFTLDSPTVVRISGPNKETVGQVAAELRSVRPPEPYKGKGIRYQGERVRRKAGKTGAK